LEVAVEYFQDAIAADPSYAPAYAGLASITGALAIYYKAPLRDLLPQLEDLARKALELDDSLAEAHAVLGLQKVLEHNLVEAEQELRRAIELNPTLSEAYGLLARFCLAPRGKLEEAIEVAKEGLRVDPYSLMANFRVGACYYSARLYDEAIPYFRMALDLDRTHWASNTWLAFTYAQKKMYEEARAQFALVTPETCPVCPPGGALYNPAFLALLGERERALKALDDLQFSRDYPETTYAVLGETDKAFEWLEKNINLHRQGGMFSYFRLHLKVDPIWDHLRDDPRFPGLLRRANLEP
jgi:Tfp pilus assembly protein PilF